MCNTCFVNLGGSFLVSGSTDHIIRIYQMTPGPPERIAELDVHNVSCDFCSSSIVNNF